MTIQIGAPVNVVTTGVAATTSEIVSWDISPGHNINEYNTGASAYAKKTIGSMQTTFTVVTTDRAFAGKFIKGMKLDSVTVSAKSTRTGVTAAGIPTGDATTYTFSISSGASTGGVFVSEPVTYSTDASGKPAEFTITFKACQTAAGTAPTVTC